MSALGVKTRFNGTYACAEQGHLKIIDQLLESCAKINDVDLFERTALARAFKNNQKAAVDHLESKGGRGKPERTHIHTPTKRVSQSLKHHCRNGMQETLIHSWMMRFL
jgi:ankyrin repeat protein